MGNYCPYCGVLNDRYVTSCFNCKKTIAFDKEYLRDITHEKKMAEAHWNYLKGQLQALANFAVELLHATAIDSEDFKVMLNQYVEAQGINYKATFVHGYGHGKEDAEKK